MKWMPFVAMDAQTVSAFCKKIDFKDPLKSRETDDLG